MGPAELAYRAGQQWVLWRLRTEHGRLLPVPPADLGFCTAQQAQLPDLPWDECGVMTGQERLLDGYCPALGFEWRWSADASPSQWHTAPDTGRTWPVSFFGSIPHLSGNAFGDVRVMWEPARLQQLVSLALLARRADAAVAARAIGVLEDQLLGFCAANPPWAGVHFISAMECALRLVAVCHAVDLVRGQLRRPTPVMAATAGLVMSHAPFIARRLSLHSSAGNHTVAECTGLIYAGTLFAELPDADRWRERGLWLLTQQMRRQVLDDGGGLEQAPWYLLLITDLAGLVIALLENRALPVPDALRERVGLARGYLGVLARAPHDLPRIGDGDDGYALSPALRLSFGAPDAAPVRTFPLTGQTRVRMPGADGEVLFDHGPLGMAPLFGHGHADALSVWLRRAGRNVLIDPGTFTYTGDPSWRGYFRSSRAHNTVTVDGHDQALQETAFMWSRPYRCELVRAAQHPGVFRCLARHDGYARIPGKIIHWRGLVARSEGVLLVWDYLDGSGVHDVRLRWHVGVGATRSGALWLLGEDLVIQVTGGDEGLALAGSTEPVGGWLSPQYGLREPATTIEFVHQGPIPCEFVSRISPLVSLSADDGLTEDLAIFREWVRQS